MGIIKRVKSQFLHKFFKDNRLLENSLREGFHHKSPLKYAAAALYLAPVHKFLALEDLYRQRKFTVSKEYYTELHRLLHIARVKDFELVRIGDYCGYIMLDDFHAGDTAYSFGLGGDVSWDKDMASRGYDVFMYDHTIEKLPDSDPHFHYFKEGIADGRTQDDRLKTLEYFIERNHHKSVRNMILKMDVEGAEWGFLEMVTSDMLSQFKQITFELHGMTNGRTPFDTVLAMLEKLNKTHQLIHLHPCNWGLSYISWGNKNLFPTIEASYASRESYSFDENYDPVLPLSIDRPCSYEWPDVGLGRWNEPIEFGDMITSVMSIH